MTLDFPKDKIEKIQSRHAGMIEEVVTENTDVPIFFVKKDSLLAFLESIRAEEGLEFNFLADLTAYEDNPLIGAIPSYGLGVVKGSGGAHRFVTVYQMLSLQSLDRIRVKVRLRDGEEVPSLTPLWKAANWLEREVFDMYGIRFSGHPNLRRIMLDERWVGHPLRKDYPIKRYQRFEGASSLESFDLENK